MTIVTKGIKGIDNAIKTINIYERASGSKMNMDKCEIYPLNRSTPNTGKYKKITTDKIKLLGITLCKHDMQNINWKPVIALSARVRNDIKILKTKSVPLYIKAKIINSIILPKFYYMTRIIAVMLATRWGLCTQMAMGTCTLLVQAIFVCSWKNWVHDPKYR